MLTKVIKERNDKKIQQHLNLFFRHDFITENYPMRNSANMLRH